MIIVFLILPLIILLLIFWLWNKTPKEIGDRAEFDITPFSFFRGWYNSPKEKGKRGESHVASLLSQLSEEYVVLNDLIFRTSKGTTQVDHIVLSKYGLFTIETKNYMGKIFGDDERTQWTQLIVTDVTYGSNWWKTYTHVTKNRFYNPVKQSYAHVLKLKELLRSEYPYLSVMPIVVFTGKADISKVNSRYYVINDYQLLPLIAKHKNVCLGDQTIVNIKNIIQRNNVRQIVDDDTHIQNVEKAKQKTQNAISSGKCPRCGGNLVLRNGRFGPFYGCSNYPRCTYTANK